MAESFHHKRAADTPEEGRGSGVGINAEPAACCLLTSTPRVQVLIDADALDSIPMHKWRVKRVTPKRALREIAYVLADPGRTVALHRLITKCPSGLVVDHRNGDTLDNRSSNLRICTHGENIRNSRPHANAAIPFKGVWRNEQGTYSAQCTGNGHREYLGRFPTAEAAHAAYCEAAARLHGEFARRS